METVIVTVEAAGVLLAHPRALLLVPVTPDPQGTGVAQRAHQWVLRLAKKYELHLLIVQRFGAVPPCCPEDVRGLSVARCYEVGAAPRRWDYLWQQARGEVTAWRQGRAGPLGSLPEWAFLPANVSRQLETWFSGQTFDHAICFRLQLLEYARWLTQRGMVPLAGMELDFDDLESNTRRSVAEIWARRGHRVRAWRLRSQSRRARRLEQETLAEVARVHVAAPEDAAELIARQPDAQVVVTPNFPLEIPPRPLPPADLRRLLFVGSMWYFPNEDAVRFLAEMVVPQLRREDPRWTLVVAGRGGTPDLLRWLAHAEGVEFVGAVDDVCAVYRGAGVAVAPIRGGGGTKIKVAEALAFGRPVIATTHAARGWKLRDGEHFLKADTVNEWIAACRRLVDQPELAPQLGRRGRQWITENFAPPTENPVVTKSDDRPQP